MDELEKRITSLQADKIRCVINKEKQKADELQEEIERLLQKRKDLIADAGFPEDYLDPPYDCPLCKDKGYVEENDRRYTCKCYKQEIINKVYEQSNILKHDDTFDSICFDYQIGENRAYLEKAVRRCKNFAENFDNEKPNLLIFGTVGLGKTKLVNCIVNYISEKNYTCIYMQAPQMFTRIMDAKYGGRDSDYYLIKECDLLIIDDLGTEIISDAVISEFYQLLESRMNSGKPIIISTNKKPSDILKSYGERISSRISGGFKQIYLQGDDVRQIKKKIQQ